MNTAVVIPLFNGEKFIRSTLESVLSQSQPPDDIIVVDDHSKDASASIAKQFPGVTLLVNPEKGVGQARKFGLSQTDAAAVAFLDQDDIWHPDHLKILAEILEKHPDCPIAASTVKIFKSEEKLHFEAPVVELEKLDPWINFPGSVDIYTPGSLLFRNSSLKEAGGWPTRYSGLTDYYLPLRLSVKETLLRNKGATIAYRKLRHSTFSEIRGLDFFRTFVAASKEAVSYRVRVKPQDETSLKNRLVALSAIEGIMQSIIDLNGSLLKKSANTLEDSLMDEPISFNETYLWVLFWHLGPYFYNRTEKERGGGPGFLLEQWPKQARNTLDACQRLLTSWGYPWFS